jgi:uncharacterized protein (TIGR02217 family)
MSTSVFPTFDGLAWSVFKTPMWSTLAKNTVSGRELRLSNYSTPKYKFKLSYEVLRADIAHHELQDFMSFFNAMQGSFDTFLYKDPADHTATAEVIGIGNGSNKIFQLSRTYGTYTEPVVAPYLLTLQVFVNGVLAAGSTDANTGIVTLTTAPASGATVTWTGEFYYRCRFIDDMMDFENFMYQLWTLKSVQFISVKL